MTKPSAIQKTAPQTRSRSSALQAAGVLMGCLVALAVLALLLQKELQGRKSAPSSRSPVARLVQGENLVQRKFEREVIWDDVFLGEVLYNHDSIRTADDSQAKVEFDDGTQLDLSENSLVVLDRSDSRINVEFVKGSMSARGGVEIRTAGGRLQIGQSGARGALSLSSAGGSLEVNVTEGAAKLVSSKGEAALGPEEQARLGLAGFEKRRLLLKPLRPVSGARFVTSGPRERVAFEWSRDPSLDPAAEIRLQVAADSGFTKLLEDVPVSDREVGGELPLLEGRYYWRVVARVGGRLIESSPPRALGVLRTAAARLEFPEAGHRASFFREKPALRFSWKSSLSDAGAERVEVSKDPQFKNPLRLAVEPGRSQRARGRAVQGMVRESALQHLEPGKWYWRVVTRYDNLGADALEVVEIASEVRPLGVAQLNQLPTPILVEPASGAVVGQGSQGSRVRLRWSRVSEAAKYRIAVASDSDFKRPVLNVETFRPEWEGEIPASGTLYWKVQSAHDQRGSVDSVFSEPRVFTLARSGGFRLVSPRKEERIRFLKERKPIAFAWEPRGGAARYEVQLAADPDFKDVVLTSAVEASGGRGAGRTLESLEVPVGSFFWRVRALDAQGGVAALSETGRFVHEQAPLLAAAEKIAPTAQAVIAPEPIPRVVFEWKPVEGAQAYFFELWRQDSAGKPEKIWAGELTSLRWDRSLESGTYHWNVRAVDAIGREGLVSTSRQLSIRFKDRLPPPIVISPAPGSRVVKDSPEAVPLRWEAVRGARGYILSWRRMGKDGKLLEPRQVKVSATEYSLPLTTPAGRYLWEVAAIGAPAGSSGAAQSKPGEPSRSWLELDWQGSLYAPSRLKIRIEADGARVPASKKRRPR